MTVINLADVRRNKKNNKEIPSHHIFSMHMFEDSDGAYEVSMEVQEGFTDEEVLEALSAAVYKFAIDSGLTDLELEPEDDNN